MVPWFGRTESNMHTMNFRIGIQRRDWSLEMSFAIEGRVGAIAGCPITKTDIDGNRERMESCPILFNYKEKYRWEGGSSDSGNVRP